MRVLLGANAHHVLSKAPERFFNPVQQWPGFFLLRVNQVGQALERILMRALGVNSSLERAIPSQQGKQCLRPAIRACNAGWCGMEAVYEDRPLYRLRQVWRIGRKHNELLFTRCVVDTS